MKKYIMLVLVLLIIGGGIAYFFLVENKHDIVTDNNGFIDSVTYYCDAGKVIHATYYEDVNENNNSNSGIPNPVGLAEVTLENEEPVLLRQTISASGIRYANEDESFVFWSKGSDALIMRNNQMDLSYKDCNEDITKVSQSSSVPEVVSSTLGKIKNAAELKDYEALGSIANIPFKYTFGDEYEGGFVAWLKYLDDKGKNSFENILEILAQPYAMQGDIYVWPAVFTKSAEEWTEEDISNMRKFATEEEIEGWREFGAYIGYRIGISKDGSWVYYLAGD